MQFRAVLYSTSSAVILGGSLLITGCGESNTSSSDSTPINKPNPGATSDAAAEQLAFNGFSENGTFYDLNPLNLAGDLSAVNPANLYVYDTFINAVGTIEKPSTAVAVSYDRLLPVSGTKIKTGNTLLNPGLAMNSAALRSKLTVSSANPVILSIPAGLPTRPEAPFFPAGTKYTAVLVEAPMQPGANHGPIISIEAGGKPQQFSAFAHQQDKHFSLRTYDKSSTIDKSGSRVLLTAATQPAVIQSRFVVLTDNFLLLNTKLSLQSMDRSTLKSFGFSSGKALLQSIYPVFPQLLDSNKKPIFNDGNHGVFCLGGDNTFNTVDLSDQTFVYPMSGYTDNTRINTLNVSANSGFITEYGKAIRIDTLNGNGTLKLIAVMNKNQTTRQVSGAIVNVGQLNGVNEIEVVIGSVASDFNVNNLHGGIQLFFHKNTLTTPLTVTTKGSHISGSFYDGTAVLEGNIVVLKSLTKKTGLSSGTVGLRSLAHHPATQGISSQAMNSLMAMLDPMALVQTTLGNTSASLSQHAFGLQLNAPYSAKHQYVTHLSNRVSVSVSNSLNNTIASVNLNSKFAGLDLTASAYGLSGSDHKDLTFGSTVTALKSFDINGVKLVPSVAVGYSMDAFGDKTLSAQGINVNLSDAKMNSVFARAMTALHHTYDGLSATLAMGLEARHTLFINGRAFTNYDSVSLAGESENGLYSVIEASFASNASRLNITLSNFNHAQIQFGFND